MPDVLDLPEGARVLLSAPGSAAYVDLVLHLLARGVVPVPLDPALTQREREVAERVARPSAAVSTADEVRAVLARLGPALPPGPPLARPLHLTSGTTGVPKGVWSGVLSEALAAEALADERDLWGFTPTDVHLVLGPLHHSAPLRFALGTRAAGGRVVVPGRFDVAAVTDAVLTASPTTTFAVPTHLARLLRHWGAEPPALESFRLVAHAGAACPAPVKRAVLAAFPPRTVWEFYGATEGQFTACSGEEWRERPGTVGRARPGRLLRVDADGTVWCRPPAHGRWSYLHEPARTAQAWRSGPDGPEFTVGDHGVLDDDGYLFLHGRREDLIVTGGVNVYPAEVEAVLSAHPGVVEVAVYGVADEEWGQRVCAAVVGSVRPDVLRAWARERLSAAKRPKEYVVRDALPRTRTGKVRRLDLGSPSG